MVAILQRISKTKKIHPENVFNNFNTTKNKEACQLMRKDCGKSEVCINLHYICMEPII